MSKKKKDKDMFEPEEESVTPPEDGEDAALDPANGEAPDPEQGRAEADYDPPAEPEQEPPMPRKKKKKRKLGAGRIILIVIMCVIFLGGLVYALWPVIHGAWLNRNAKSEVVTFYETQDSQTLTMLANSDSKEKSEMLYPDLYAAMAAYNERVYEEKQENLGDAWTYAGSDFDLAAYVDTEVVGVISIPSLDIEMPLYLGASYQHMADGCAQLAGTSMPIGGKNTNSVICGHCGWGGADYFRYLCTIEEGAYVYVTNFWETLTYKVVGTKIIYPSDLDELKIQEGKDMLTLFTCHPFASGGRYRFVVYCERVQEHQPTLRVLPTPGEE